MKIKKKKKAPTNINKEISSMIKNDGELQIMDREFKKEKKRINSYIKSLSIKNQMLFMELFSLWVDLLFELNDLYKLGFRPKSKAIHGLKEIMWKIIDDLSQI